MCQTSYTWQSIIAGLECFRKGCVWRVGDGEQINIWTDNWLPSSQDLKIQTPRGNNLVTSVSELINPVTGTWDADLIKSLLDSGCTPNSSDSVDSRKGRCGGLAL